MDIPKQFRQAQQETMEALEESFDSVVHIRLSSIAISLQGVSSQPGVSSQGVSSQPGVSSQGVSQI
jgi:hypothetical protein